MKQRKETQTKKSKGSLISQPKFDNSGLLYPPKLFGEDKLLLVSILLAFIFCIPSFRAASFASLWKLGPSGILSVWVFRKKLKIPNCEGQLSCLSLGLLFHSFGDCYLHQSNDHIFSSILLFGIGWIFYIIFIFFIGEIRDKKWKEITFNQKIFLLLSFFYAAGITIYLLSTLNSGEDGRWELLVIPYAILELTTLSLSIITGEYFIVYGTTLYIISDSLIAIEELINQSLFLITWTSYYGAQWLITMGCMKMLQRSSFAGGPFGTHPFMNFLDLNKENKDFQM